MLFRSREGHYPVAPRHAGPAFVAAAPAAPPVPHQRGPAVALWLVASLWRTLSVSGAATPGIWCVIAPFLPLCIGKTVVEAVEDVDVEAVEVAAMLSWPLLMLVEVCKVLYIMMMFLVECCLILMLRILSYLGIIV